MKKLVLLLLLSVVGIGVAAENAHAIFGGIAWRRHYRKHRRGLLSCVEKQEKVVGPPSLQAVRDEVDLEILWQKWDWNGPLPPFSIECDDSRLEESDEYLF